MIAFRLLDPDAHRAYTRVLHHDDSDTSGRDSLPTEVRARVEALLAESITAPEERLERLLAQIVEETYWYVLRPDEIARRVLRERWGSERLPRTITVAQAATILAALGAAGYPIWGNGAPDFDRQSWDEPAPIRGAERERVIREAAAYWARRAAGGLYVSVGDCRGWMPRPVQYDEPGSLHPDQRAALTLGPARNDYMRRHTRLLLVVED